MAPFIVDIDTVVFKHGCPRIQSCLNELAQPLSPPFRGRYSVVMDDDYLGGYMLQSPVSGNIAKPINPLHFKTIEEFRETSLIDITRADVVTVGDQTVKNKYLATSNFSLYR